MPYDEKALVQKVAEIIGKPPSGRSINPDRTIEFYWEFKRISRPIGQQLCLESTDPTGPLISAFEDAGCTELQGDLRIKYDEGLVALRMTFRPPSD